MINKHINKQINKIASGGFRRGNLSRNESQAAMRALQSHWLLSAFLSGYSIFTRVEMVDETVLC